MTILWHAYNNLIIWEFVKKIININMILYLYLEWESVQPRSEPSVIRMILWADPFDHPHEQE